MLCVPFTIEDSEIVVRAAGRRNGESLVTLAAMIVDGNVDDMLIKNRVEARQVDLEYAHYLEEQMHEWWQQMDEDDAYIAEFDDDYRF
jgi:hypothetical protein